MRHLALVETPEAPLAPAMNLCTTTAKIPLHNNIPSTVILMLTACGRRCCSMHGVCSMHRLCGENATRNASSCAVSPDTCSQTVAISPEEENCRHHQHHPGNTNDR
ncbi:hypothetical protein E2C01_065810 [Portunus trituberculatus]|uniref:Uncharacterized protein n=1 Tax=Portunus trituberculatus TaxID=210409 RepID=A0A5B7HN37_PORTR|nr:hypothetical protein [Portunus trituberculatus]